MEMNRLQGKSPAAESERNGFPYRIILKVFWNYASQLCGIWLITSDGQVDSQSPQPMQVFSFTWAKEGPVLKQFEEIC
jgi:hypothetical protein